MSTWREIRLPDGDLIRYRTDPSKLWPHGHEIQRWEARREAWHEVRNVSSLVWFAIGFRAGLQSAVSDGVQGSLL